MTSPRAICVGEGLAVLVAEPGPLENSDSFTRSAGGAEANVARVLAQLGVSSSWISRVGNDGFGRYLLTQLDRAGVDVSAVVLDDTRPTGMYVKQRGGGTGADWDLPDGDSRMTYFRTGSAASALSPDDVDEGAARDLIRSAEVVHFSGITVALSESAEQMTRSLLACGTTVSFDLNYRPALWANRIEDAPRVLADHVRGSDVVLMGADEARVVFGIDDPAELRAKFPEPRHLVVKNDAHVVTAFDGDVRVDVPALRLAVLERIGAGDAFAGGFLGGLLNGASPVERVRLGHLCAAGALTAHGDVASILDSSSLLSAVRLSDNDWRSVDYGELVGS
ncbi:sugar kinase [Rhodococcoides kyotonense]|uniref:2-dehydro-3-deoxygluconokinase n=1 Tax=Rhodococcoides kyotonense TaxID=398843 RepID=A0A239IDL2_9NOCA|nr:sugar kinase [Rhodococcus kyotonensis]SNS91522.1 2-dehydro-3-deoxygluconokinase [Rhodococcus kyotonensis]